MDNRKMLHKLLVSISPIEVFKPVFFLINNKKQNLKDKFKYRSINKSLFKGYMFGSYIFLHKPTTYFS